MLFPVIEFLDGHIRIFNSNTRIYRNELMREPNAFDDYLMALTKQEALNIRADIHYISEYYIAVGIMQEHNIRPRHWHYLGEKVPELRNSFIAETEHGRGKGVNKAKKNNSDKGNKLGSGDSDEQNASSSDITSGNTPLSTPEDTQLAPAQTLSQLNYKSLLPPASASQDNASSTAENSTQTQQQNDGANRQLGNRDQNYQQLPRFGSSQPGAIFSAALPTTSNGGKGSANSKTTGASSQGNKPKKLVVRIPDSAKLEQLDQNLKAAKGSLADDLYNPVILNYLLDLLAIAEREKTLDLKQAVDNLKAAAANYFAKPADSRNNELVAKINKDIAEMGLRVFKIFSEVELSPELENNKLLIKINTPKPSIRMQAHQNRIAYANFEGSAAQPTMLMRLYPTTYKGEFLDFPAGFTLLVHPEQFANPEPRWRPVAVFDPEVVTISLGFLHFGIDKDNYAVFDSGINHTRINFIPISDVVMNAQDSNSSKIKFLWLIAIVMLLLLFARRKIKSIK